MVHVCAYTRGRCVRLVRDAFLMRVRFPQSEMDALKEQLRQAEEQLQATRQQASMLASELRDSSSARDRSISDLHRLRVEMEALGKSRADAQARCARMEEELDKMRAAAQQEAVRSHFLTYIPFRIRHPDF